MTTRDLTAYVLVRTDLPSLNPGKAMSQVHHAGVQMVAKYHRDMVNDYVMDGIEQGAVYFNTTIVLGATREQIMAVGMAAQNMSEDQVLHNLVVDPSYPFIVENEEIAGLIPQTDNMKVVSVLQDGRVLMTREELTCAWFLGSRTDPQFRALFEGLELHP